MSAVDDILAAASKRPWETGRDGYGSVRTLPENAPRFAQRTIMISTKAPMPTEGRANNALAVLGANHLGAVRTALGRSQEALKRVSPPSSGPDDDPDGWACNEIMEENRVILRNLERDAKALLEGGA